VDLAAVDRNIRRAEEIATAGGIRLRPHFKAHKCTRLMRRQLGSGIAVGATCQTAREALALADAGITDILVANEVVTEEDLLVVVDLTRRARITLAVDAIAHVALLEAVAPRFTSTLDVLIEVDAGAHRCGIQPGSAELLHLAGAIQAVDGLRLRGILSYEGHAVLKEDRSERERLVRDVADMNRQVVERLRAAGHAEMDVTGGATGTLELVAELASHHEAQPGSYVLMDATYARSGLPFEPALFCLTSVISRAAPDRAVADAGLKALSAEYGMPVPIDPGLRVTRLADEHAVIEVGPAADPHIGDRLLLQPAHVDPTVNLHSRLNVWDGASWEAWATDGRYL
jgi:D-serine deaminase-like pyridoxal phosphate-dependent protein